MKTTFVLVTVVAAGLAACEPSSPTARLADLPDPRIPGSAGGFWLDYDRSMDDCFELSSDVHGTVDGKPLIIDRGGLRSTPHGDVCDRIGFRFPAAIANQPATSITLADGETTWAFSVAGLAPGQWTISAPASVTEGGDLTVSYAPVTAGVAIRFVYLDRRAIGVVTASTTDSMTIHIEAGEWSSHDSALHGTSMPGTVGVQLSPLPVTNCPATQCDFMTDTPEPARPITIVIP